MASIGPQLPSKRKRSSDASRDDDTTAVAVAPCLGASTSTKHHGAMAAADRADETVPPPVSIGPTAPPSSAGAAAINSYEIDLDDNDYGAAAQAPLRLHETCSPPGAGSADADLSSDSDDYGPRLPSAAGPRAVPLGPSLPTSREPAHGAAPQRDEWMLAPPTDTNSGRWRGGGGHDPDPSLLRSRKFATKPSGPSAGSSSAAAPSVWTETPEQKLRRLQDAVLGRESVGSSCSPSSAPFSRTAASGAAASSAQDRDRDRKIAAAIDAQRGESLYDEHVKKRRHARAERPGDDDDDPSARPFDRDKDLALGRKIGTAQMRQLVSKSANFGGRFHKGSYL